MQTFSKVMQKLSKLVQNLCKNCAKIVQKLCKNCAKIVQKLCKNCIKLRKDCIKLRKNGQKLCKIALNHAKYVAQHWSNNIYLLKCFKTFIKLRTFSNLTALTITLSCSPPLPPKRQF
jgi:hypothetical protein